MNSKKKPYLIDPDVYEGIIKIIYDDNHDVTIDDIRESLVDLEQITGGKAYPILKILGKYSSVDGEVRKFISSREGMKYSTAEAFVTTYLPHKIIGNFYMNINKPIKPTAFFNTEAEAVAWLRKNM